MRKSNNIFILFILLLISFLFCVSNSSAEEKITLTTYYPAPYGVYKEMRADQMAVGSPYRNSSLSDGKLIVSGCVGIGTSNPVNVLQIGSMGSSGYNGNKLAIGDGTAVFAIDAYNKGGSEEVTEIASNVPILFSYGNTEKMRIDTATGKVGIGTGNPGAKLEVAGQVKITGGNPGVDKVLTSDGAGLASWKNNSFSCRVSYNGQDQGNAYCNADEYLTGGGCYWDEIEDAGDDEVHGHPTVSSGSTLGIGWRCTSDSGDPTDAYAVCCKSQMN